MSDEYEHVARGKLKLKTDSNKISKKKKKKDKKEREKLELELEERQHIPQAPTRQMTKAEQSFKKMQEKMVRIEFETTQKNSLDALFFFLFKLLRFHCFCESQAIQRQV